MLVADSILYDANSSGPSDAYLASQQGHIWYR